MRTTNYANYIVNLNLSKYATVSIVSYVLLALPVIISSLIVAYFLGASAIIVINLFFPLLFLAESIHTGIGTAAVNCYSLQKGANKVDASKVFSDVLCTTLLVSLLVSIVSTLLGDRFFYAIGATMENLEQVAAYGRWFIWVIPPMVFSNVLFYFVHADNNPVLASYSLWIYNGVNLLLDLLLIVVLNQGIGGAALACLLAEITKVVVLLFHFRSSRCSLKIRFTIPSVSNVKEIASQMSISVVKSLLTSIALLFVNRALMNTYSVVTLSIYYVLYTCRSFLSNIYTGAKVYLAPLVSVYYGEKDYPIIHLLLRKTLLISLMLGGAVMIFLVLFDQWVFTLFHLDYVSCREECRRGMLLFVAMIPLHCINTLMITQYQASRNYIAAFLIVLIHDFIGIVTITYLVVHFFPTDAIWTIWIANEVFTLILWLFYVLWMKQQHTDLTVALLPKQEDRDAISHYLLSYDGSNLACSLDEIEQKLLKAEISPKLVLRARMTAETLFITFRQRLSDYTNKECHCADLKMDIAASDCIEFKMKFLDDKTNIGKILNTLIPHRINDDELELSILKNMSRRLYYNRTIGICFITVEVV